MPRALVIGAAGQDGSYLCEQLAADGVQVFSLTRYGLFGPGGVDQVGVSLDNRKVMRGVIEDGAFDEIYYLAAHHHSAEDPLQTDVDTIRRSFAVHVDGLLNVLDALVAFRSRAALFYAASSHVFGVVTQSPQSETTPMMPICAYGVSKAAGVHLCRLYRNDYGLRANVGFLFNHESPRRSTRFLSRKVARAAVEIQRGLRSDLSLGDPEAEVDWGYAPEYTDAMRRILTLDQASDYVIASGRSRVVRDFVAAAFARVGLNGSDHIKIDPTLVKKIRRGPLLGNSEKLSLATGWIARTSIEELATLMVDAEQTAYGA